MNRFRVVLSITLGILATIIFVRISYPDRPIYDDPILVISFSSYMSFLFYMLLIGIAWIIDGFKDQYKRLILIWFFVLSSVPLIFFVRGVGLSLLLVPLLPTISLSAGIGLLVGIVSARYFARLNFRNFIYITLISGALLGIIEWIMYLYLVSNFPKFLLQSPSPLEAIAISYGAIWWAIWGAWSGITFVINYLPEFKSTISSSWNEQNRANPLIPAPALLILLGFLATWAFEVILTITAPNSLVDIYVPQIMGMNISIIRSILYIVSLGFFTYASGLLAKATLVYIWKPEIAYLRNQLPAFGKLIQTLVYLFILWCLLFASAGFMLNILEADSFHTSITNSPGLSDFLFYTFGKMTTSDLGTIEPVSFWAQYLSAGMISVGISLLVIFAGVVLSFGGKSNLPPD